MTSANPNRRLVPAACLTRCVIFGALAEKSNAFLAPANLVNLPKPM